MTETRLPEAGQDLAQGRAVVVGASGGIGAALQAALAADGRAAGVVGFSRTTRPAIELTDEASDASSSRRSSALVSESRPDRSSGCT
jgi:short-subunit dehydrogenase